MNFLTQILHKFYLFFGLTLAMTSYVGAAHALDQSNFIGTWHSGTVHVHVHHPHGDHAGEAFVTIKVTEIHAGIIHAKLSWKLADDHEGLTDHAGELAKQASTDLAGVVHFDNVSGQLLNTEDNGIFHVRLVDADTMQAVFVEQGHNEATVYRTVFTRHRDD